MEKRKLLHHYHSPYKRAMFSFALVFTVMVIGTVGLRWIENISWVDAFYFMSMIATAQGPTMGLHTDPGKIFASIMAFISVGSVAAAVGFLLGPFFGKLIKVGVDKFEEEVSVLESKSKKIS